VGGTTSQDTSATATGGAISGSTGGAKATGGAISGSTGGTPSTSTDPSTVTATKADNCGTATAASGSFTVSGTDKNYFKVGDFGGYGFVYISPTTDPAKSVTCDAKTFGSSTSALCGAGIVPADPVYNAVGGIGFNLNQATSGGKDSAKAITTPATVGTVTITFANTAATGLHIQIVKNAAGTDSGGVNYCYDAKSKDSPLTLNASEFTTTCWDPAAPGDPWDGTGAQSLQFIIPSDATSPTTFDACIENVVFS
jgi:hypothetical protein